MLMHKLEVHISPSPTQNPIENNISEGTLIFQEVKDSWKVFPIVCFFTLSIFGYLQQWEK